jgi:hypothetical protein
MSGMKVRFLRRYCTRKKFKTRNDAFCTGTAWNFQWKIRKREAELDDGYQVSLLMQVTRAAKPEGIVALQ